jgi:phage terminase small subunit
MGSRGRKSADELTTRPVLLNERRPEPPESLSPRAAAVWKEVVGTVPLGWFSKAQYPIVMAYCRHAAQAEVLAEQVDRFEPEWLSADGGIERLNKLLSMAERESRAMTACARSMRITKQSQIEPRGAGRRIAATLQTSKPWETDDDEPDPADRFFAWAERD